MLTQLVAEALHALPSSSRECHEAAGGSRSQQRLEAWSVAAVHQGDGRNAARTLHPLIPSTLVHSAWLYCIHICQVVVQSLPIACNHVKAGQQ